MFGRKAFLIQSAVAIIFLGLSYCGCGIWAGCQLFG
jgi:hypothetical protein